MVINTNLAAQASSNTLNTSQARLAKSLARISSGNKIIQPGDDAGGLAVGTKLDAQVHRLQAAKANVGNATSFVQTQDGYLKKIAKALDRMSELSVLAMDATKSDADRELYNKEFVELQAYVQTAADKEFNGVSLFSPALPGLDVTIDSDGTTFTMKGIDMASSKYSVANLGPVTLDTQASELGITEGTISINGSVPGIVISSNDTLEQIFDRINAAEPNLTATLDQSSGRINLANASGAPITLAESGTDFLEKTKLAPGPGLTAAASSSVSSTDNITAPGALDIKTVANAKASLSALKDAVTQLASDRATIGAYQARLSYSAEQLAVSQENLMAASSRIQDVDIAEESTEYAKANILVQSGTAMLAQANQIPQQVLRLLQ